MINIVYNNNASEKSLLYTKVNRDEFFEWRIENVSNFDTKLGRLQAAVTFFVLTKIMAVYMLSNQAGEGEFIMYQDKICYTGLVKNNRN